jgi:hypothetical protein
VKNIAAEFCLRSTYHARRVLSHAVNQRHGTDGFTSRPKEVVLRIFITLKNPSSSAGFEPANLGSSDKHTTTRPLPLVWRKKFTDVSEVLTAYIIRAIALMTEAVCTSETSLNFYQTTRHNIPEDSHLHTRGRENLTSHQNTICES